MRNALRSCVALFVVASVTAPAPAQTTYFWDYSATDWATASDWSPNAVPTSADTAILGVFDGPTLNLPSFAAPAAAGRLRILGPRGLSTGTISGAGNTLTLGTGGVMTDPTLAFRGTFGATINLDNLRVNVANGTSYAAGSYPAVVGAMEFTGFGSRIALLNGSQLRLVSADGTTNSDMTINGAQFNLSAGTQITNGVGVNTAPQGAIRFGGGGILNVSGANSSATSFTLNQVTALSGHGSVGVLPGSGTTPTVQLTLGNGSLQAGIDRFTRDSGGNPTGGGFGTLEFTFTGTGANTLPGLAGSQASLVFAPGPTGIPTTNGVVTDSSGSPYVILTGPLSGVSFGGRFATINAGTGQVTAQTGTTATNSATLSAVASGANVLYKASTGVNSTLANAISPMTLVLEPAGTGQSLDLNTQTLTTNGLMLERAPAGTTAFDFAITDGTLAGGAGPRNVFVLGSSTTSLSLGAVFAPGAPVVKAGGGLLVLTGTTDQVSIGNDVVINQGVIRGRIDGANLNFGSNNTLAFRGGLLEVDANAGTSNFTRSLGNAAGQVNWTDASNIADRGSGGFSVVNGSLAVNVGGAAEQVVWNGQTGDSRFFVRSGSALRFGTTLATGVVTFSNPIALDDGSVGPYETRQILVQAPSSQTSVRGIASRVRFAGAITGGPNSMLSISGGGAVELPGPNTYAGGTSVDNGVLLISNTIGSATGFGRVVINDTLRGTGIIAPADGNGVTAMPQSFIFLDNGNQTPGHLQIGTAGVNTPVTLRPGAGSIQPANLIAYLNSPNFDPAGGPTSYSRLTVRGTGIITLNGAGLAIGLPVGYTPSATDRFVILDNQTGNAISGAFNGIAQDGTAAAQFLNNATAGTFHVTYIGDVSGNLTGGNDVVLYGFTPVPEPAVTLLVAAAGAGLVGAARRPRRRGTPRV
jgi:autotransporter-associated beta strand protein